MAKTRTFPEHNYKAIYHNGKTIRLALDVKKPITELKYPEFYDVSITNKCNGKCCQCYMDSKPDGKHFDDIVGKAKRFFGSMTPNQRPLQIAAGGGETTLHPDFPEFLKTIYDMGITPNYTTNGMNIENVVQATKKYCGGVALSCHPHLKKYWKKAAKRFIKEKIKLNFHIIISDKASIDYFVSIYNKYKDKIEYFVLLPYVAQGRARRKDVDNDYLVKILRKIKSDQVAFGAKFYELLKKHDKEFDISLYSPEIFSKYLQMDNMKLYKSSFDLEEVHI